jgi:hypothetical protein
LRTNAGFDSVNKNAPTFQSAHFTFAKSRLEILRDFVPINNIPERFQIIRALVLVFQIIRVFPNVAAENHFAFATGDGFAHERVILIRRGNDFQFSIVGNEPNPAAAETADARRFKFRFEFVEAAER